VVAPVEADYDRRAMWFRLASCVLIAGCGYPPLPAVSATGDAAGDATGGPGDGSGDGSSSAADCLQRWLDGTPGLAFSTPQELTALGTAGADTRDPWISADGLRLYFDRNPSASHGGADVYLAIRSSTAVDFTTASSVDNLDTPDDEGRVSLSGDETILVMSSNHLTAGNKFQIFVTTRADTTQPFPTPVGSGQALVAAVNTTSDDYFDPFLTQDGLTLYVAPALAAAPQQIRVATRAAGQNFGPSTPVAVINSGTSIDADPALSLDERILVFSSTRPAGAGVGANNLWYATRQSATDDFSLPQLIPAVNSDFDDGDPMLSADGCELYFSSKRVGGKYQLFHAQVMK
jgi:hypothetical protein